MGMGHRLGPQESRNRTWSTPYRGTVYIHASSTLERNGVDQIRRQFKLVVPDDLPKCAVVAVDELKDVVTRRRAARFGKWFEGAYGFDLTNVRPFRTPVRTFRFEPQEHNRFRFWAEVPEFGGRVLRVANLEDKLPIHNPFP